jgi:hypothetical protein
MAIFGSVRRLVSVAIRQTQTVEISSLFETIIPGNWILPVPKQTKPHHPTERLSPFAAAQALMACNRTAKVKSRGRPNSAAGRLLQRAVEIPGKDWNPFAVWCGAL